MKKEYLFILLLFISSLFLKAQLTNSVNIVFPPLVNPPLGINNYTRASQSINLQCNPNAAFQFGLTTPNTSGMLNLSIGPYPTFVNSAYLGSGINPSNYTCGTVPALDISKPVGETTGDFQVSQTGAATYNIPIIMSPGTKGIQPALSISYNSQSAIGLLGVGWNLNGLSAISRTGKTPMHDGIFAGISFSVNDVFSLDGNRLFALNGLYGLSQSSYYTEAENFSKITSINTVGSGPEKFEVIDKNGNTSSYGFTSDSRLAGIGNNSVFTWYLNRFTDEFGNYMTYSYKQLSGETVIDKIDYTCNSAAGLSAYNHITFDYIPLAESNSTYIKGVEFKQSQLLKEILCWAGTSLFKKYIFDYEWKEGTYLASVKEVDASGNELNPTRFCWDDPNDFSGTKLSTQNLNTNFVAGDYLDLITVPADFDADGFSDFACFNTSAGRLRVYENTFVNNYGTSNNNIGFIKKFDNPTQTSTNDVLLSSNICDENKDGKQEIFSVLSPTMYSSFGNVYSDQYYILKTSYDNTNNVTISNLSTFSTNTIFEMDATPTQFMYNVQDYTGDGVNDILKIDNESISLTTNTNTYVYPLYSTIKTFARPFSFDVDGVSEYIVATDLGTSLNFNLIRFSGNTMYATTYGNVSIGFPDNGITQKNLLKHISYGDLNGDGIDDLVYINEHNTEMYVQYGTGLAFTNPKQINAFTQLGLNNDFDLSCVDVNNDGKMDIIINENINGSNLANYYSYLSFGDIILKGGAYQGSWKIGNATKVFYQVRSEGKRQFVEVKARNIDVNMGLEIHQGDFNGDGIFDYTDFSNGSDRIITNNVNGEVKQMLTKIYTPLRNNYEVRYANIASRYSVNNGNKDEVLRPISNPGFNNGLGQMLTNLYCVSHVFKSAGYAGQFQNTKRYIYAKPTYHQFGRGFLGFEEVNAIDLTSNIGSQITNSFNPTYFLPITFSQVNCKYTYSHLPPNILSYVPDYSKLISKTTNTIAVVPGHSSGYFVQVLKTENTDYLNSRRQSSEYTYNMQAQGNIQTQTDRAGWNLNAPVKTGFTNYFYILNNGNYKLWKQNMQQIQNGQSGYDRDVEYAYDNSGHLINTINDQNTIGLSNNVLTTSYSQFNAFGNATKVTISAQDVSPRTSAINYDATGRFIIKRINALGNFNSHSYEPLYGNMIQSTDINGIVTKYEYDGLGRLSKTHFPNNTNSKQIYTWENPNNYNSNQSLGAFSIKTEADASPYSKIYYTGNGLVLRNETQDFSGNVVISDNVYTSSEPLLPDAMLLETSAPHYLSQNKFLKSTFEYETTFYRPSITKSFSVNSGSDVFTGFYIQTNYNTPSNLNVFNPGFIETENQLSQKVKKQFNSAGQVTLVVNSNPSQQQQVLYSYNSNGEAANITLSSVSTPNQNIVHSLVYNGLGQRITSLDPSHGTINYKYNTIGELLQETNSSGSFDYTYDVLGRVLSKTGYQSGNYNYQYVSSGNGNEQLWKVTGPTNITEYQYDGFGKLTQTKESNSQSNKIFASNFTYDNYGREKQHSYPSGYTIINNYNSLGYLTSISNTSNQTLWQLKNMDALGRITEFDYGNGITTKNKYNDLNQLEEIEHGSIHKQNYAYDPNSGNLYWRRFRNLVNNTDLQEFFAFDDNDRLTVAEQYDPFNNTILATNSMSFDLLGNITHKDDAGDYQYTNATNPFMLSQMSNLTNNVSLNTLSLSHTDFNRAKQISEMGTNKLMDFAYGNDEERFKITYKLNGTNQYTRYYADNYDRQETSTGYKEWTYIFAPSGLCATYYNNNGSKKLLYTMTDHLGSPVVLTSTVGNNAQAIVDEYSFDAWGRRRNASNWTYNNIPTSSTLIRGFTFHEQLDELGLVNMNARMYDPVLGRCLQPDKLIQAPDHLQNFNRYAYAFNNPVVNKDPDGNSIAAAVGIYYLFFTDNGYQFQKNYSPVAAHVSANFGSNKRGIGVDASAGMPQIAGPSYRVHGGVGYYWKNNDVTPGWETRYGSEWAMGLGIGGIAYSTTHYNSPGTKFDQTDGTIRLFSATGNNLEYENDWQPQIFDKLPLMIKADHGDRHRTAAMQLNVGNFTAGFNLFTGDPGLDRENRVSVNDPAYNNRATYIPNGSGDNPDEFRTGAAYIGYGPVKVGWNSEKIRHAIQNRFSHDFIQNGKTPWFKQLDIKPKFYFNFGSSGYGNGLY